MSTKSKVSELLPELVGTAEAAAILGVERPRIGRWIKAGVMPEPVQRLKATPIWTRAQIEGMVDDVEARRRAHDPEVAAA